MKEASGEVDAVFKLQCEVAKLVNPKVGTVDKNVACPITPHCETIYVGEKMMFAKLVELFQLIKRVNKFEVTMLLS